MNWWWSRNHCIEPVRPHVSMPTVPKAMQRTLDEQPVCLLGERWTVPKPKAGTITATTCTHVDAIFWVKPPVQRLDVQAKLAAVDYDRLPA